MNELKNNGIAGSTEANAEDIQQIEAEIAQTRAVISEDLRTLGDKLSPENLKAEAKAEAREVFDEAKHAAAQKFRDVKDAAMDRVSGSIDDARDTTVSFVRQNAAPLALIGLGVAWLWSSRRNNRYRDWDDWERRPSRADRLRDATYRGRAEIAHAADRARHYASEKTHEAGELVHRAEHAVSETAGHARDVARREFGRARETSRHVAEENPLALGAVAVAAGIGVGLMLPHTDKEDELLGDARDRLLGQAQGTAKELGAVAKDAARAARDTVSGLGSTNS